MSEQEYRGNTEGSCERLAVTGQGPTVASGNQFLDWLRTAGIIPELARRVVIEATAGDVVHIYVELYGAAEMLSVEPPPELRGAQVHILGTES